MSRILPCLREASVVEVDVSLLELCRREEPIQKGQFEDSTESQVTRISISRKTYLTELALLGVLLDGVALLVGGNLVLLSVVLQEVDVRTNQWQIRLEWSVVEHYAHAWDTTTFLVVFYRLCTYRVNLGISHTKFK